MTDTGEDETPVPCPNCGAEWVRTELVGNARRGGGYRVWCHACDHEWDDVNASHHVRETAWRRMKKAMERASAAIDLIHQIPRIPWWRIVARRRCQHEDVTCIHGDGIHLNRGARAVCIDCGRPFAALPAICRFTEAPHSGRGTDAD